MDIEAEIERFIIDEIVREDIGEIGRDESLIARGYLDSAAVLTLIGFLERRFNVRVDEGEIKPANFETINKVSAFIERKQNGRRRLF